MTDTQHFQRVAELFEAVRTRPRDERESFLRSACCDEPDLLAEVLRLLTHHDEPDTALDTPVVPGGVCLDALPAADMVPLPDCIGQYRVKGQLGIGGMGVVYLAEQDHPHREVAIKVIRPGVVGLKMLRRFELEAETLGRLQHPGIAQVYEAGAFDDGGGPRPFFAMERINGELLTKYAEVHGLDDRLRLELFARVCDAVHHAHQRGVIHRDIKPANILVDASGQPKILDFGVARVTDCDLQFFTMQTSAGQLIGTLPYMSPEQLDGREREVDVRSDVYGLGVTLYELLCGRLPYDLDDTSLLSAARKIAETEPTAISAVRSAYRGDLNTIVLKALAKDPAHRYQAVSAMAEDIRRFLDHEPIVARRATAVYKLRKFTQRHTGFVVGLAVASVVLAGGVLGVVWQSARVRAEAQTRREVAGFLHEMLTSVDPAKTAGEVPTVRALLDDASVRLGERFREAPLVGADLHETIGETYHSLGEYAQAEAHLRTSAGIYRTILGDSDDRTLGAVAALALALREQDRTEEAASVLAAAVPIARDSWGKGAERVLINHAVALQALGRYDEAEAVYVEVYQRDLEFGGPDSYDTLCARSNLAGFLISQLRFEDALAHIEPSCSGLREAVGDDHPKTIAAISNLGAVLCNLGRFDEGVPLLREAVDRSERVLGPAHLHTLRRQRNVVRTLWDQRDGAGAARAARELLVVCQRELGDYHAETIGALELATTFIALGGRMEDAEQLVLEWHGRLATELGAEHRTTGRVAFLLYNLYDSWGKADEMSEWLDVVRRSRFEPPNAP